MSVQTEKGYFTVAIPIEFRPKLERMAARSVRTLGSVVAKLISDADESAPEWNIVPRSEESSHDSGSNSNR